MPGFTVHVGKIAVYNQDHVDTDRIIPARFLTMVTKKGYGELLFADARKQESSFPLDEPATQGASILVTGTNFGCGSSREHAVWAIQQAGFQCVIARIEDNSPGFSDIFRQNSANCGLLLVELPASSHQFLVEAGSGSEVTVDLPNQIISCGGHQLTFEINPATKDQLIQGLDLIGTTLVYADQVSEFESKWDSFSPSGANN
ncbi:3-isopropylmalate dehydratase small subunit [Kamptonema cortianum]|nr:3-isopropylmalate dehydratase small subunit [Geitlerinema splendidum]MDK3156242.1 3-isopropylmalate dehydratase small subunit [Kamptonema cortianum]